MLAPLSRPRHWLGSGRPVDPPLRPSAPRRRPPALVPDQLSAPAVVVLIAPVALATGSFFPALFDLAARTPLAVFAMDAIGAGFGALAAGLVPITLGLGAFLYLAVAVFLVTATANLWFHHRLPDAKA